MTDAMDPKLDLQHVKGSDPSTTSDALDFIRGKLFRYYSIASRGRRGQQNCMLLHAFAQSPGVPNFPGRRLYQTVAPCKRKISEHGTAAKVEAELSNPQETSLKMV